MFLQQLLMGRKKTSSSFPRERSHLGSRSGVKCLHERRGLQEVRKGRRGLREAIISSLQVFSLYPGKTKFFYPKKSSATYGTVLHHCQHQKRECASLFITGGQIARNCVATSARSTRKSMCVCVCVCNRILKNSGQVIRLRRRRRERGGIRRRNPTTDSSRVGGPVLCC